MKNNPFKSIDAWFDLEAKPLWYVFLIGASFIPLTVLGVATAGAFGALLIGADVKEFFQFGAFLGVAFALLGVFGKIMEILFRIATKEINFRNAVLYMLGYFWMWSIVAYGIYYLLYGRS